MKQYYQLGLMSIFMGCATSPSHEAAFFIEGNQPSVSVPFTLDDNRNFIEVKLNGQGPFQIILDTGGGDGILITPSVARAIGVKVEGAHDLSGAGAVTEQAGTALISEVQIGPIHLMNLHATVISLDKLTRAIGFERMDGVIGQELFARLVTTIDFESGKIIFTRPSAYSKLDGMVVIPLVIEDGAPYIQAGIGDVKGRFLVDTGDRSSLSFCGPFTEQFNLLDKIKPQVETMTGWGVGGPIPAKVGRVRRLDLGAISVQDVVTRFPTLKTGIFGSKDIAGLIGNGVLKKFQVTFDYSRAELLLTPNSHFADRDPYDRAGIWIGKAEDGFEVLAVVKDGPADQAGIKVGDRILAIDGITGGRMGEARRRLKASGSMQVQLRVRSDLRERTISMQLRDLI